MSLVSVNVILGAVPETVTVPLFAVKLPLAIKFPVTSMPAEKSALPANVETPATLKLSKFVWPSTSKSPFISTLPASVIESLVAPAVVSWIINDPPLTCKS